MNIQDIREVEQLSDELDPLDMIFKHQKELSEKYHSIEKENGVLIHDKIPVDIDSYTGQLRLKDFMWRTVEELGEAMLVSDTLEKDHFKEELADTLHFLVELCLLANVTPDMIVSKTPEAVQTLKINKLEKIFLISRSHNLNSDCTEYRLFNEFVLLS